jgi:integrase
MSRLRLKYVHSFVDHDGRPRHYFRRKGYKPTSLRGVYGSEEFMAAYHVALDAVSLPIEIGAKKRSSPGSLSAAIAAYYGSLEFRVLTGGTPAKRRAILETFREQHGDKPVKLLPRKFIVHMLGTMKPHTARNWLKTIRALMQFCIAREMIGEDPTLGIKAKTPRSDGHHTWSEDEIAAFEAHHPIGSKARLALALGLYTLQRRSDVVRMGRQHVRDGWLHVKQQKTGKALALPVRAELQTALDAPPTGHLTFLITKTGKSYEPNDFSEQFRQWCNDATLPRRCTFHGLRKAGCRRLAELGCSANEIAAWSGQSLREVERYTKAADQKRLARNALARSEQNRSGSSGGKPDQSTVANFNAVKVIDGA